ncbi:MULTISPECIES: SGNH/GDSL hydrolase family protein [Mycolicibacterium]|uniref:Lysophospholipase L1-like esterase n=3 Tax=Mycolicibacterium gilvum TaxID=1804 RepID=E6TKY0_MYCSR|nr:MULTISPECIES: SGNH/GDSL hydrolase family protein [Mycolicibacterium]ABP44519.1 lipolytic enzyme, G-D-S-L family [Mycolicibacterium gilvum PYR-GCK]ADT98138.1 lysophospholipase L1-like esterase [Mycolicibacterium gilvum Spyr1]MBV5244125.1 SGNH/GDSL hydrolase family protein [Mycolicibacterium sp. PAM1]MCV7058446.1 SGNH/GDSL hydrolase family protein [Mycolicibacterium gilvum]STZ45169.1 GDSL family lipase [Mycolicibacterium gilvum]
MGIPRRRSTVALAAAATLASTGTAYVGARNLLTGQADQARQIIPKAWDIPPRADGVYSPGGGPVERWHRGVPFDLHLMIFGDSTATGYGCTVADEVPGVLIARGLAEESGKRIRLSTKAIVGATSKGLSGQIDAMYVAGPPPDAAVIMIGANDITKPNGIGPSARRLGRAVRRLRGSDAVVVVGTCPDFGVITAIPQPLRWVARSRGLRLAHAQAAAVRAAGGVPVPFSDLLAPHFYKTPELLFSPDMFHPSAAGYELAATQLLPALCEELGEFITGEPLAEALESRTGEGTSLLSRVSGLTRLWRRSTGVPAPIVVAAG